jgi:hypothetical protein
MTLQEQFKEFQKSLRSHHAGSAAWFEVVDRCVDEMLSIHIEQLDEADDEADIIDRLLAVPQQRTDANNRALCVEAAAEIERLRALVASGKLDPAQVWPS